MTMVELKNVSFSYDGQKQIVHDINLAFTAGTATAIIGQNGAGKTTTVKMMNHLLVPTQGQILVNGEDIHDRTTAQVAHHVGYAFQNPDDQIFNNSIQKEIEFGPKRDNLPQDQLQKRVQVAAKMTGLSEHLDEHPYNFPYSLRKFITIASILAMNPETYIFDEPTAGQDHLSRQRLSKIITQLVAQQKCVIVITHDMNFVAENFNRVIVLSEHQVLADDTPQAIFSQPKLMTRANIEPPEALSIARRVHMATRPLTVTTLVDALKSK
ncbi:energy-coupling factor ABC transporter ATP-binding protein [Levilactobacillus acidifarinae]|nr:ABC transporter ATP-binding protein [Levilactobacillus acidifarinae]GEO70058.1 ABC transporter ATP-binding protein [Levilactobacillus acidifarinae]